MIKHRMGLNEKQNKRVSGVFVSVVISQNAKYIMLSSCNDPVLDKHFRITLKWNCPYSYRTLTRAAPV